VAAVASFRLHPRRRLVADGGVYPREARARGWLRAQGARNPAEKAQVMPPV
jgi:hypothetical protein